MHAYLAELEIEERKNERKSLVITTIIFIILLLLSFLWTAWRQRVPPPGEEYEVLGAIDFGDYSEGSRQVNNFEPPAPDPAETQQAAPEPEPEVQDNEPTPAPEPVETQPDPSPVTVNETPTPKPEPVKPKPKPEKPKEEKKEQPKVEKPAESTSSKPVETPATKPSDKESGSNHGKAESGTGNSGTPNVKVLDPDGLYSFGTGTGGGLNGRSPVALPKPSYTSQEEGEVEFKFVIAPNGSVVHVFPPITSKLSLKQAGIAAIKRWKFSPLPPGQSGNQTVKVTIKFKLK